MYFRKPSSYAGYLASSPPGEPVECCQLPRIGELCWLKLDIEGAEYEVLPQLLERSEFPRWLSAELHHIADRGQEMLRLLRSSGYDTSDAEDSKAECAVIEAEFAKSAECDLS